MQGKPQSMNLILKFLGTRWRATFVLASLQMTRHELLVGRCRFDARALRCTTKARRGNLYFYIDYDGEKRPRDVARISHATVAKPAPKDGSREIWSERDPFRRRTTLVLEPKESIRRLQYERRIVSNGQGNDWYGEGDDMIVDRYETPWHRGAHPEPKTTSTAFCPSTEYSAPYHGVTLNSGTPNGRGMYRYHIEGPDPLRQPSGCRSSTDSNKLSNSSSTAYCVSQEPHKPSRLCCLQSNGCRADEPRPLVDWPLEANHRSWLC